MKGDSQPSLETEVCCSCTRIQSKQTIAHSCLPVFMVGASQLSGTKKPVWFPFFIHVRNALFFLFFLFFWTKMVNATAIGICLRHAQAHRELKLTIQLAQTIRLCQYILGITMIKLTQPKWINALLSSPCKITKYLKLITKPAYSVRRGSNESCQIVEKPKVC